MIDPNPPNDDKYDLRGIESRKARDDGYKISIIAFMMHDKHVADRELKEKGKARNHTYIGVRKADIRSALGPDGTLIGAGDVRFERMLYELEKLKLIEKNDWTSKRWTQSHRYYTLTEDGKKIWDELQKLKKDKISKLLYCLKDLDGMFERNSGKMLVEKFNLEKVQSAGKF